MKLHEAIEKLKPVAKDLRLVEVYPTQVREAIQCVIDHLDNSYTKMASKPDHHYQTPAPATGCRRCHTCGCTPMKE